MLPRGCQLTRQYKITLFSSYSYFIQMIMKFKYWPKNLVHSVEGQWTLFKRSYFYFYFFFLLCFSHQISLQLKNHAI